MKHDGTGEGEEYFQYRAHDSGQEKEKGGYGCYHQQAMQVRPVNLLVHAVKLPDDHIQADQKRNGCQKG